ncbi:hypothetical protein LTR67_003689 [Exophiala xenobiotica]
MSRSKKPFLVRVKSVFRLSGRDPSKRPRTRPRQPTPEAEPVRNSDNKSPVPEASDTSQQAENEKGPAEPAVRSSPPRSPTPRSHSPQPTLPQVDVSSRNPNSSQSDAPTRISGLQQTDVSSRRSSSGSSTRQHVQPSHSTGRSTAQRIIAARLSGHRPPSPLAGGITDGTDIDSRSSSQRSSSAASEHQQDEESPNHPDFSFNIVPPTRAPTTQDMVQQMNEANRIGGLHQPRSHSRLRISTTSESPSRSRSSSSTQRSPSPDITEDTHTGPLFPNPIPVTLNLTFGGEEIKEFTENEVKYIHWTDPENYKSLVPDAFMSKLQYAHEELKTQDIYLRYGTCQVRGPSGLDYNSQVSIVEDYEQLGEAAIRGICNFIAKHPYQHFDLQVYWDYGSAQIKRPTTQQMVEGVYARNYAIMIKRELERKTKKNFLKKDYIPRRDLNVFLQGQVIENIVRDDESLHFVDDESRSAFIRDIQSRAPNLFAICVYRGLEMNFLKHLMEQHNCQDTLNSRPKPNMECNRGACTKHAIQQMTDYLPQFFAEKITRDYQYRELSHEKVLPLHDIGDDDGRGCATRNELGEGAYGTVYSVKINLAHNAISRARTLGSHDPFTSATSYESPERLFAVKQFSNPVAFQRERLILKQLADYPHPHIVLHLTTWTQDTAHYILYDLARCNLREYMNTVESPPLSRPHVLWFLRQLDGLAKAIFYVHHFKRPTLSDPKPEADYAWGRHNDIKPENILVFEKAPNQNPVFKLTDFGCGVFTEPTGDHSVGVPGNVGTETYWPPDQFRNKKTSRPFDMWAIGCVYLESLLWLFGFFQEEGQRRFATARMSLPGQSGDENARQDRYWYKEKARLGGPKSYHLKPAVREAMDELKTRHCSELRAFTRVLEAVELLLDTDPKTRMTADGLSSFMTTVVVQAEADLKKNADYYRRQYRRNMGGSDVPDDLMTERMGPDLADRSSITRSSSMDSAPSRANSMRHSALTHIASAPDVLMHVGPPGQAGGLGRALEDLTTPD